MKIVLGIYGGCFFKILEGKMIRFILDKVRGVIFNMIGFYFEGGWVLDLYVGSGGLFIEVVLCGMFSVVLVEWDCKV